MVRVLVLILGLVCGVAFAAEHGGGVLMYGGASGLSYADMVTAGASHYYGNAQSVAQYNCVGSGNYCVSNCVQATVSTYRCDVRDPWGGNSTTGGSIVIKCSDGFTGTPSATNTISSVCGMSADEACGAKGDLGSSSTKWVYDGPYPGFGGYCIGGCSYAIYGNEGYDKVSNKSIATGVMKPSGGGSCTGNSPRSPDTAVNDKDPTTSVKPDDPDTKACQPGQVPYTGTVNGKTVTVCGAATKSTSTGTTSTSSTGSTTTNNGGTQSTTNSSSTGGQTTQTTCENGQCTTTKTSTGTTGGGAGADGGTSTNGSDSKTEPKESFCKDNPKSPLCKDSDSSFGGSCGAFHCDGDAVQCAIAREQHQRNCQLFDDRTPLTEIGEGAAGAGNRPSDHPGNNPDDIDVGARMAGVARDNPFGDGCPRDFDLVVMGNVVTVPLSNACDVLKLMGEIAVAFAFVAGARIVMSGVSSGAT